MKKILLISVCAVLNMVGIVKAESSLMDFGSFFARARAGYSVNQHMEKSTVIYSAVQRFHNLAGVELANFDAGYDTTDKHPVFAIGIRADNIIPMIWGGDWGKSHVTTAELPAIEFGPYASIWPVTNNEKVKFNFSYGIMFAVGFAK